VKKTTKDFMNPAFSLVDMLVSIRSSQQFDNPALATDLTRIWGLE